MTDGIGRNGFSLTAVPGGGEFFAHIPPMFRSRRFFITAAFWAVSCYYFSVQPAPGQERLTRDQESRLQKFLPRTYAKLKRREPVVVVSVGDSISTFYQPAGFPRYDSGMSWQGRMLSRIGGYFSYHNEVRDLDPHKEILARQKQAEKDWDLFQTAKAAWDKGKKGSKPEAPDSLRFNEGEAGPVAMSVPELIRQGLPASLQPEAGAAIWIYNLARDGSQVPQVLESLTTEAFPAPPAAGPDLVTICYGVNDAVAGSPLSSYREFLRTAVKLCQKNKADVILAAPPVSFEGSQPRQSLGRARPYAIVAREVAAEQAVAFVDLGEANVWGPSDLFNLTAADAFESALEPIQRQFAYRSDVVDTLHPNSTATLHMGDLLARQLLGEPLQGPIQVNGILQMADPANNDGAGAELDVRLFNPTQSERTVVASVLSFPGWAPLPGTPDALFNLRPGKARHWKVPMVATDSARASGEGGFIRGSLLLSDDDHQQLADVRLSVLPVSLVWPEGRIDKASGDVLLNTTLTNTGVQPVKGTAHVKWMGREAELPVSLAPSEKTILPLRLTLPDALKSVRFLEKVTVSLELDDQSVEFSHLVEGVRYAGLKQPLPMVVMNKWNAPAPDNDPDATGATLTVLADQDGIWFFVDVPPGTAPGKMDARPWGSVEVQMDGRNASENGTLGFVDRLLADIPWQDGYATVRRVRPATFGTGYNMPYEPRGFLAKVQTRPDGSRRIEFAIMRSNLRYHEWSLDGSGQNTLGFNVRLGIPDPAGQGMDASKSCAVTNTDFPWADARGLTVLELSPTPAARWSLRIY